MVTMPPSAWAASTVHDFTALPSSVDGAGAALRRVAADVRAGQPETLTQHMDQELARLQVELVSPAVDDERDTSHDLPPC